MGRRQKIKDEDGISFTRQLLKLYEKFPDPEPRELARYRHAGVGRGIICCNKKAS